MKQEGKLMNALHKGNIITLFMMIFVFVTELKSLMFD